MCIYACLTLLGVLIIGLLRCRETRRNQMNLMVLNRIPVVFISSVSGEIPSGLCFARILMELSLEVRWDLKESAEPYKCLHSTETIT